MSEYSPSSYPEGFDPTIAARSKQPIDSMLVRKILGGAPLSKAEQHFIDRRDQEELQNLLHIGDPIPVPNWAATLAAQEELIADYMDNSSQIRWWADQISDDSLGLRFADALAVEAEAATNTHDSEQTFPDILTVEDIEEYLGLHALQAELSARAAELHSQGWRASDLPPFDPDDPDNWLRNSAY